MRSIALISCLALTTITAIALAADGDVRRFSDIRSADVIRGGSPGYAKAPGDTARLIGPPGLAPLVDGTFEGAYGPPPWNGWTSLDWTVPDTTAFAWHVSTYYAIDGTFSAYCGDETIPSCGNGDPEGGYGNSWFHALKWGMSVADNSESTGIGIAFSFAIDTEKGYDWGIVARELPRWETEDLWHLSGDTTGTADVYVTYEEDEYFGDNEDEIGILFIGSSDSGWSDEDCDYASTGLMRIDDVVILVDNPLTTYNHDFEDGTLGEFEHWFPGVVGDFTQVLSGLGDPDVCPLNHSDQVVFIDDGRVHPETGGTEATADDRKYAFGYAVNYTGGLTFNDSYHLRNSVVSPVIPWPDPGHDGARLGFSYMLDSFLIAGEAGVCMEWMIRSTDGDAASIESAEWQLSTSYYGGPYIGRRFWDVSELLVPGRTFVQVAIGANENGYELGIDGDNGSPSPFIDNVRLESYPFAGPDLSTRALYQASDAFPEIGYIDYVNLIRNHVRFDMAQNISPASAEWYQNGDSITIDAVSIRDGADLTARPNFHYKLKPNSLFDPYRTTGLLDTGTVVMDTVYADTGTPIPGRFRVDLPDTGFLYPGDMLHWYYSAEDAINGHGGTAPLTSTLQADTTGWTDFADPLAWSENFTMHCLPSLVEDTVIPGVYNAPPVLFWDDAEGPTSDTKNEWYGAFANLGLVQGRDFDTYFTKDPSSAAGTGLGGRATVELLSWYGELLYSSGYMTAATLSNGDWSFGGSDDISLLEDWLDLGLKDMFLTGNSLTYDLDGSGAATSAFLHDRMMVTFAASTHRNLLDGQLAPRIEVVPGSMIFTSVRDWFIYGGCHELRNFDLVETRGAGQRLAEFTDNADQTGAYTYSPLTGAVLPSGSRIISMTADLAHVDTYHEEIVEETELAARARILKDLLFFFGTAYPFGDASAVPNVRRFTTVNSPNPFNPATRIAYTIRAPGRLDLKIFNVRGELVKTLINGHVEADGYIEWDGTNGQGGKVSSGVYFYRAQMGGGVQISKMALVK